MTDAPSSPAPGSQDLPRPRSCSRCGGNLIAEWFDGDWLCVLCGAVFYSSAPPPRASTAT
jgi:ribosomal protein S27AE